jgi:hypothetical protein
MPPLRHHSKLFQQMMYHQTICILSLQNDDDMTTILLKCIVQGIRIWVKIGSLICAGKLEDRPFFSLNFKGIPSQESNITIFSGLNINEMTLSDQNHFPVFFQLRKMNYRIPWNDYLLLPLSHKWLYSVDFRTFSG